MDFKPIDISMKAMIERYTSAWKLECSEYTFSNILSWGSCGNIFAYEDGQALYILIHWCDGESYMFAPLTLDPDSDYYQTALDKATEYMRAHGMEPIFKAISGPIKTAFERCKGYELTDDRDNSDYVYTMESLRDLSGKKLHAKRNHIHQFMAEYGERFEYVKITPDMLDECIEMFNEWMSEKPKDEIDILELSAIKTLLTHMDLLGIRGGGIRIDGRLAAFTLGQKIDDNMAVVHIEKADNEIVGLFPVINNQFVQHELTDVKFINREEDMGMEGLRKAKLSYFPAYMIDKFDGRPV